MISRRQVLAGASALALAPLVGRASPDDILEAKTGLARVVHSDDYPETAVWGFNGSVPGPEIRVKQGSTIRKTLRNSLSQPTSVHWHGLRIDNAMDGVPGLTQDAVEPGEEFAYEFTAPDAGTYWYHSHNRSTEQVARGLYGLFIVDEPVQIDIDHDVSVVLDDWRLSQDAQITDDFGNLHDLAHAGRIGNFVSAMVSPSLTTVKQNERLRIRLVNVANDRVMLIGLHGLTGLIVALDGMPLERPQATDHVVLGPAQRADFVADVTEDVGQEVMIAIHERGEGYALVDWKVGGVSARAARDTTITLPQNPGVLLSDASGLEVREMLMEGGAMGGMMGAMFGGRRMGMRDMMQQGQVWALNGVAGMPDEPFATLDMGETIRIPMRNDTAFPHAMHLHGHHFQEVFADGTMGPLRDTILVDRGETREIAVQASNPGDWLLHCHMLSHQAAGMKTWIRVKA